VRSPDEFLKLKDRPADGRSQRTLVNLTVATVFPNGLASRFHQVVYQPLTERAAADGRQYGFSFESDSEVVQLRGARVYHKDGKIEDAVESGESDADSPEIAMYTSARVFTVRFPRLSPGDVVELRYRVEDVAAHNAFADYFGDVEYLQSRDPIARAEYVLIGPKSRAFYFNTPKLVGGGNVTQTTEDKGESRITRFVATDVPAVDPEPGQPPFTEFFGHVHVSTYKTWDDVGKWYWGLVKDQFNADDEVRRRVAEVTKGLTDERAKVRAVYDYVVQKTRYVALEFGIHGFKPYSCAQIFGRGFGDCKDKATLIVTMLKELGIPATIVIVRTGMRGLFEDTPASLAPFDHAIAYVPSLDIYLDGTAEYTGSGELPAMDRGAMALQINEGKPKLVHLPDPPASESRTTRKLEAQVGADGSAQIDWQTEVTGVHASAWRARYHAETSRKQRVQEDLAGELPGLSVAGVEAGKLDDVEAPVTLRAKAKVPDLARKEDATFSVPAGPREYLVRELATQSQRKIDLRVGARTTQITEWTLKLPTGAKVSRTPKATQGTSPFGSFDVQVDSTGGTIKVKTTIVIDRARVTAAEYPAFRAFCETADRALGQRVVYGK
jgi:transglutaminase-like putative cysteine protease